MSLRRLHQLILARLALVSQLREIRGEHHASRHSGCTACFNRARDVGVRHGKQRHIDGARRIANSGVCADTADRGGGRIDGYDCARKAMFHNELHDPPAEFFGAVRSAYDGD